MRPDELIAALESGPAAGTYLLCAADADAFDTFLADSCTDEIVAGALSEDERRDGLSTFDGDEFDLGGFLAAVHTMPMFGARSVVVVRRVEKLKADAHDPILAAVQSLPETTVLVLVAAKLDGRLKFTKQLKKASTCVDVSTPTEPDALAAWVGDRFAALGKAIPRPLALELARRSPRLHALAEQVEQIALYLGPATKVSAEAVEALSRCEPEDNVFAITDALAARDATAALGALREAERAGAHYLELIGLIESAVRRLSGIRRGIDDGLGNEAIAQRLGLKRGAVYYQREKAGRWSAAALEALHRDVLTLEYKTKSGGGDPHLRLESFVVRACASSSR